MANKTNVLLCVTTLFLGVALGIAHPVPRPRYIGTASYYGAERQGRKMANGERFDRHKLTAASWYFPLGTVLRIVNLKNGKSVNVVITDRGPNLRLHRLVDLSEAAADQLDYIGPGLAPVFTTLAIPVTTESAQFDDQLSDPRSRQ